MQRTVENLREGLRRAGAIIDEEKTDHNGYAWTATVRIPISPVAPEMGYIRQVVILRQDGGQIK